MLVHRQDTLRYLIGSSLSQGYIISRHSGGSPGAPSVFFPQEGRREGCDHSTRSNRNTCIGVLCVGGGRD